SILAVIILSFVFICCFIPLLICLACKLFGCCTCTGCRTNDGLTRRYIFWQNSTQKRLSNEHRKQNGNIRNNIPKVEFYKPCHKRNSVHKFEDNNFEMNELAASAQKFPL
ncbi:unnamed protein product, partial [Brugia timori]